MITAIKSLITPHLTADTAWVYQWSINCGGTDSQLMKTGGPLAGEQQCSISTSDDFQRFNSWRFKFVMWSAAFKSLFIRAGGRSGLPLRRLNQPTDYSRGGLLPPLKSAGRTRMPVPAGNRSSSQTVRSAIWQRLQPPAQSGIRQDMTWLSTRACRYPSSDSFWKKACNCCGSIFMGAVSARVQYCLSDHRPR